MKAINYLCPHGLDPGPYAPWTDEHKAEHTWLLGLCQSLFGATHVIIPTESVSRDNSFSPNKLRWLCEQALLYGMTPVVWLDKWLWVDFTIGYIKTRLSQTHEALSGLPFVWNLSSELDLLWLNHPVVARDVLEKLCIGKAHLMALGVRRENIWTGGATVEGTVTIGETVCPGRLTWTAWQAIQRGIATHEVYAAVYEDLDAIIGASHNDLLVVELGWSVAHPVHSGPAWQREVIQDSLDAANRLQVPAGLWLPIDCPHDRRDSVERRYGLLGVDGDGIYPREGLQVWQQ